MFCCYCCCSFFPFPFSFSFSFLVGCAQAYGYCSTTHLDITIDILRLRLDEKPAGPFLRNLNGFFSKVFSSAPKIDIERRNSIYLAYGYVAAYAPIELIPSRAEVMIITPLKLLWQNAKKNSTKLTILKVIDLIGKG